MKRPDGLLKAGLIVNIVLSATGVISSIASIGMIESIKEIDLQLWEMMKSLTGAIALFGIILPIVAIPLSILALSNPKYKVAAGVFGVITNLIAGILILCGKYVDEQ